MSARFDRGIWVITFVGFLNQVGFAAGLPFLALYLNQERGLSMTWVGVVILVSGLVSAGAQLFAGAVTDRFGRRPVLLGTIGLNFVLQLAIGVLIALSASVLAIVVLFTVIRSSLMMMRPPIQAIVADLTPKARLTEVYGLLRVGQNIGWAAGPAMGGYLLTFMPYAWLFGVSSVIFIPALIIVVFFMKESMHNRAQQVSVASVFSAARDHRFLAFTGLSLLVFMVMGQMISTLSVYTVGHVGFSPAQFGTLLTVNGLVVVALQYPIGRAISGLPKAPILVSGALLYAIGYLLMGWVGAYWLALVAMCIITLGEIIFSPTSQAVVGELASERRRGRFMGFYGLSETLGTSFGPMLGAYLLDVFPAGPLFIWGIISGIAAAAVLGFHAWGRTTRNVVS